MPALVEQATQLLLVARMLERVADHATNIVENIYYVETGQMRPLAREAHEENRAVPPDHHKMENRAKISENVSATLVDSVEDIDQSQAQIHRNGQNH